MPVKHRCNHYKRRDNIMQCLQCGYAMTEFEVDCPRCKRMAKQEQQNLVPLHPPATGNTPVVYPAVVYPAVPPPPTSLPFLPSNNSGTHDIPPAEVRNMGFCWGGFGLTWIWGIGNQFWPALFALIPYVNIVMAIWLGIKGHELAWASRRFENFSQYKETMRIWNLWGIILGIILGVGFFLFFIAPILSAILFPFFAKTRM